MARPSPRTLQQRLSDGVILGAEGYVFELERRGYVQAGPFVPEVILDEPDALRQLHREFLRAGSDVMVALTYYAHRDKLAAVGRADDLEEMNRQAVRIANEIAAEGGALVAGNICNTWAYDPSDPEASGAVVRAQYEQQLGWAAEEGVDFVIAETNDYLGEALIGLQVCQELGLPAMVTFASVQASTTYDGYDYVEACRILADRGATVVGLNCSRGPETMLALLERIRAAVDVAVAAQPVPYRTSPAAPAFEALSAADGLHAFPIALEPFQCTRFEMADFALRARRRRRGLHRHLLRRGPSPRARHGRGPRAHNARQPLFAGDRAAPGARHAHEPHAAHGRLGSRGRLERSSPEIAL